MEQRGLNVFLAYAHEDEQLLERLRKHLSPLIRPGSISVWYDRDINAGIEWEQVIKQRLDNADLILLLVSPDFVFSNYCYNVEMQHALEKHKAGKARVVPIILRPVLWRQTPFAGLQVLPKNGEPVTSERWHDLDDAFFDVATGIDKIVEELRRQDSRHPLRMEKKLPDSAIHQSSQIQIKQTTSASSPNLTMGNVLNNRYLSSPTSRRFVLLIVAGVVTTGVGITIVQKNFYTSQANTPRSELGRTLFTFRQHEGSVNTTAWSPHDGAYVASGDQSRTIYVWNSKNGDVLSTYQGNTNLVSSLVWSPDGTRIASAGYDIVQIWNPTTGDTLSSYRGHKGAVWTVAWSPDGKSIASASADKTIHVWDSTSAHTNLILNDPYVNGQQQSYNNDYIDENRAQATLLKGFSPFRDQFSLSIGSGCYDVCWSPDGKQIATSDTAGKVLIWDVTGNGLGIKPLITYQSINTIQGNVQWAPKIAWSHDGTFMASSGNNGIIYVWKISDKGTYYTYSNHKSDVSRLAWSPIDRKRIASASFDGTVQIWSTEYYPEDNGIPRHDAPYIYRNHSGFVRAASWSPDGTMIASGGDDKTVQIWRAV